MLVLLIEHDELLHSPRASIVCEHINLKRSLKSEWQFRYFWYECPIENEKDAFDAFHKLHKWKMANFEPIAFQPLFHNDLIFYRKIYRHPSPLTPHLPPINPSPHSQTVVSLFAIYFSQIQLDWILVYTESTSTLWQTRWSRTTLRRHQAPTFFLAMTQFWLSKVESRPNSPTNRKNPFSLPPYSPA